MNLEINYGIQKLPNHLNISDAITINSGDLFSKD
jgi:hypothetical protein